MKDDSLERDHMKRVSPGSPLTMEEWQATYRKLRLYADMMSEEISRVARKITEDAGLDPNLLGIHPHNAMCGKEYGNPWPDVDYNRVQVVLDLMRMDAGRQVADDFDSAVRTDPHQRWLDVHAEGVRLVPT